MYTNIPKPSGGTYTPVNLEGRYTWDDASIFYDDPNVYWDGINATGYTNIAKPALVAIIRPGMATGVLGPPTYSVQEDIGAYTLVSKPV
jgi:hypothetical protein